MLLSSRSLLLFLFSLQLLSSSAFPDATVHQVLTHYGLPAGLFPDSVTSFSISDDGNFSIDLLHPCGLHFDNLFYYDRRITGTLSRGAIKNLKGVEMKRLFLWFDVQEITADRPSGDFVLFHVGWVTKKRRAAQFRSVRSCVDRKGAFGNLLKVPPPIREIPMLLVE